MRLETALEAAQTQADLNLRSRDIAEYLDLKTTKLEERIRKDLDGESLAQFVAASKLWQEYRIAQAKSESDLYRGGSIQPLIYNRAFSRITKERLIALQELNPEGKYREK